MRSSSTLTWTGCMICWTIKRVKIISSNWPHRAMSRYLAYPASPWLTRISAVGSWSILTRTTWINTPLIWLKCCRDISMRNARLDWSTLRTHRIGSCSRQSCLKTLRGVKHLATTHTGLIGLDGWRRLPIEVSDWILIVVIVPLTHSVRYAGYCSINKWRL